MVLHALVVQAGMRRLAAVAFALLASALGDAQTLAGPAMGAETCGTQPCTWNFNQTRINPAQPAGRWGAGVTVAVVDTWVDFNHPDLRGRVVGLGLCAGGDGTCQANAYRSDECVHGTHVAGTVASTRYGVAPQARILAVQVLTYDPSSGTCSGTVDDVAAGIRFAVSKGARVLNLSLGGLVPGLFQSAEVTDAVHDAARAGAVVIFAAGNSTVPLTDDYGSDAILVAATGPNGRLASYSSRGGSVSLASPGGDDGAAGLSGCATSTCIMSTVPGNEYDLLEGTSMAAPHVAGTAALLFAQIPGRGRADVIRTLQRTARAVSGARDGRLDAAAALKLRAVEQTTPRTPTSTPRATSTATSRRGPMTPLPTAGPMTASVAPMPMTSTAFFSDGPTPGHPGDSDVALGRQPPSDEPGVRGMPALIVGALLVLMVAVGVGVARAVSATQRRTDHDREPDPW